MHKRSDIIELIEAREGLLKLRPTYVHRWYPDLDRLGQRKLKSNDRQFIPERWIGSSIEAINARPIPSGGLSMIDGTESLALRDVIRSAPIETIGESLLAQHGVELRVLV